MSTEWLDDARIEDAIAGAPLMTQSGHRATDHYDIPQHAHCCRKAFVMQMEVLRRLRNGGQQFVRVEHVHVKEGGQALIGNLKKSDL